MSDLTTKTLGEICDLVGGIIRTGPFGSQLHESDYQDDGVPVVMPKNIVDGGISVEGIARIGQTDVARLAHHVLRKGDIVYGRRGDIGRQALIRDREDGWLCGTRSLRISLGNTIVDPAYLHYYLSHAEVIRWISNQAIGATMPNLNTSILRRVPVSYPTLEVQREIASMLGAYDDLIENNTRRIAILEEMARSIYREWFEEFRFPGHARVRMVPAEFGIIPEGWCLRSLLDVAEVMSGGTPKTGIQEYWNGSIPFFTPRDTGDSWYVLDTERTITERGLNNCNSRLYPTDTVFLTARGTVGKVVMAGTEMAMSQSSYALQAKPEVPQYYLFLLVRAAADRLRGKAHGAVFDTIVVDTLRALDVVYSPKDVAARFSDLIQPMVRHVHSLLWRSGNLRRTRDVLLGTLFGPEERIGDINAIV